MNLRKTIGNNPFETIKSIKGSQEEASVTESESDSSSILFNINQTVNDFSEISEMLNKNSSKLEKQTNQASTAGKQLSANMMNLGTSLEKLKNGVKKITTNASNSTKSSLTALKAADATNAVFSNLLESSKELDKIDKIISGLAQQINLFALNASIEAARAGEAGRGFAVVANEIKELSKETAKIADDIRSKIENFYQDSKKAIESLNEVSANLITIKNSQTVIEQSIEEQNNTITDVTKNSSNLVKSTNSVNDNILNVYKLAKLTTEGSEMSLRYAHSLTKLANDLKGLIDNNK
jgi:methyl-accepting chemotaxis protein